MQSAGGRICLGLGDFVPVTGTLETNCLALGRVIGSGSPRCPRRACARPSGTMAAIRDVLSAAPLAGDGAAAKRAGVVDHQSADIQRVHQAL